MRGSELAEWQGCSLEGHTCEKKKKSHFAEKKSHLASKAADG